MTHKDHGYYYSSRRARAAVTSRVLYGTTNEISRFTKNNASAHALRANTQEWTKGEGVLRFLNTSDKCNVFFKLNFIVLYMNSRNVIIVNLPNLERK